MREGSSGLSRKEPQSKLNSIQLTICTQLSYNPSHVYSLRSMALISNQILPRNTLMLPRTQDQKSQGWKWLHRLPLIKSKTSSRMIKRLKRSNSKCQSRIKQRRRPMSQKSHLWSLLRTRSKLKRSEKKPKLSFPRRTRKSWESKSLRKTRMTISISISYTRWLTLGLKTTLCRRWTGSRSRLKLEILCRHLPPQLQLSRGFKQSSYWNSWRICRSRGTVIHSWTSLFLAWWWVNLAHLKNSK